MNPLRDKPDTLPDLDFAEGKRLLEQGAGTLEIALSDRQLEQFMDYLGLLIKWNRVINLTALHSVHDIILKHFLDSLTLLPFLPETFRLMDLGSGAGFPGLPVKIMAPDQEITLVEASAKKVSFLREVIRRLGLSDVSIIQQFLNPNALALPALKAPFDIITARAVGRMANLLPSARSYLAKGGKLILMKGKEGKQELIAEAPLIQQLGFQMEEPVSLTLPLINQERILIFLTKITL
jgi:16S rRNA (guanine527-N7)-methyltransferase